MKMKHLAVISSCALGLAAMSAFATDPVFIFKNNNSVASNEDGTVVISIPSNAFEAYGRYAPINDPAQGSDRTTLYVKSSNEEDAQTYPSTVAGQYSASGDLFFYVLNTANDTYCGFTYSDLGTPGHYSLYANGTAGHGIVGNYTYKCPHTGQNGRVTTSGATNGYFSATKSQVSGGPVTYTISFSNPAS